MAPAAADAVDPEVEKLYQYVDTLSEAKDKSQHVSEYEGIIAAVSQGSNKAKQLAAQLIPRFFKFFPDLAEKAVNAHFDLIEMDDLGIRVQAIRGLPLLCKDNPENVSKIADVLGQFLVSEENVERDAVYKALMSLLRQDVKASLNSLFGHINGTDEHIRDKVIQFLKDKVFPVKAELLKPQNQMERHVTELVKKSLQDVTGAEFKLFMDFLSSLSLFGSGAPQEHVQELIEIIEGQADLDAQFNVADVDHIDRLNSCMLMAIPFFMRGASCSKFLSYLNKHILPVLDKLPEERKPELLRALAGTSPYATAHDARQLLPSIVQLLKNYMPRRKTGEEMNFTYVKCLLYIFQNLADKSPNTTNSLCGYKNISGQPSDRLGEDFSENHREFTESSMEDFHSLRIESFDDDDDDEFEMKEHENDDEEDEDEPVTLGFLEKVKNPMQLLRHLFPSKAGGVPAWLNPVDLPSQKSYTCGFCAEPLQFLLQVYAPISGKEFTFHRMLFVFMCPSMSCLLKDQHEQWQRRANNPSRSVKVFRCQLPRVNAFYSSEPPKYDGTDKPSNPGAPLCSWCGSWKGEKVCSRCKKARYCSEKHQVLHWKAEHKTECVQTVTLSQCSESILQKKIPTTIRVACKTIWPEYEIAIEDEGPGEEASNDCSLSNALVTKEQKSDESFHALLDRFEADDDKKSWASFQEHIADAPHQVLRYCRDVKAKPLWPVMTGQPTEDDIPKCSYCGGPMCYEFQILPQLLYYFNVKNDPDSLDWATIVVYACEASCEASASYKEEFAWVQLYSPASVWQEKTVIHAP